MPYRSTNRSPRDHPGSATDAPSLPLRRHIIIALFPVGSLDRVINFGTEPPADKMLAIKRHFAKGVDGGKNFRSAERRPEPPGRRGAIAGSRPRRHGRRGG